MCGSGLSFTSTLPNKERKGGQIPRLGACGYSGLSDPEREEAGHAPVMPEFDRLTLALDGVARRVSRIPKTASKEKINFSSVTLLSFIDQRDTDIHSFRTVYMEKNHDEQHFTERELAGSQASATH